MSLLPQWVLNNKSASRLESRTMVTQNSLQHNDSLSSLGIGVSNSLHSCGLLLLFCKILRGQPHAVPIFKFCGADLEYKVKNCLQPPLSMRWCVRRNWCTLRASCVPAYYLTAPVCENTGQVFIRYSTAPRISNRSTQVIFKIILACSKSKKGFTMIPYGRAMVGWSPRSLRLYASLFLRTSWEPIFSSRRCIAWIGHASV